VPAMFDLYDRNGDNPVSVGGDSTRFDPGSAATLIYDYPGRRIRTPATADVVDFVTVTDRLPAFELQSTGVVPDDVPEGIADRYRLFLALVYGRKPVVTGTFTKEAFASMRSLLIAVRGSAEALREKPLAVFDCCPTSPLKWSDLTSQALIDCARNGIPVDLVPAPLIGATSPVTLEGTLVQHTAENLSGIVIHQTAATGAPVVYGGAVTLFDMRRGTASMSATEAQMVDAAYAQIGRHFGLAVHSYMGLSDAKTPDVQAGFETTFGAVLAVLSGVNIASGGGLLNYVNCQSLEKLVVDNEICASAKRLASGIAAREEDAGFGAIAECAAQSSFLTSTHTRRFFRNEAHYPDHVIDRVSQGEWEAGGAVSAADRAHDAVQRTLADAEPALPPRETLAELESLMKADAVAAGMDDLPRWRRP